MAMQHPPKPQKRYHLVKLLVENEPKKGLLCSALDGRYRPMSALKNIKLRSYNDHHLLELPLDSHAIQISDGTDSSSKMTFKLLEHHNRTQELGKLKVRMYNMDLVSTSLELLGVQSSDDTTLCSAMWPILMKAKEPRIFASVADILQTLLPTNWATQDATTAVHHHLKDYSTELINNCRQIQQGADIYKPGLVSLQLVIAYCIQFKLKHVKRSMRSEFREVIQDTADSDLGEAFRIMTTIILPSFLDLVAAVWEHFKAKGDDTNTLNAAKVLYLLVAKNSDLTRDKANTIGELEAKLDKEQSAYQAADFHRFTLSVKPAIRIEDVAKVVGQPKGLPRVILKVEKSEDRATIYKALVLHSSFAPHDNVADCLRRRTTVVMELPEGILDLSYARGLEATAEQEYTAKFVVVKHRVDKKVMREAMRALEKTMELKNGLKGSIAEASAYVKANEATLNAAFEFRGPAHVNSVYSGDSKIAIRKLVDASVRIAPPSNSPHATLSAIKPTLLPFDLLTRHWGHNLDSGIHYYPIADVDGVKDSLLTVRKLWCQVTGELRSIMPDQAMLIDKLAMEYKLAVTHILDDSTISEAERHMALCKARAVAVHKLMQDADVICVAGINADQKKIVQNWIQSWFDLMHMAQLLSEIIYLAVAGMDNTIIVSCADYAPLVKWTVAALNMLNDLGWKGSLAFLAERPKAATRPQLAPAPMPALTWSPAAHDTDMFTSHPTSNCEHEQQDGIDDDQQGPRIEVLDDDLEDEN
eukprot:TRINITY_DN12579_c0_g1_i1.p1 TRINITY_DN12579_c0_g1~~TRINITY_DN12579_c0_g1_i1.p1  ORF type:complete len:757 (+),score=184.53 TRINITY_DN12579_c0_g1_i1:1288-3558(+)